MLQKSNVRKSYLYKSGKDGYLGSEEYMRGEMPEVSV